MILLHVLYYMNGIASIFMCKLYTTVINRENNRNNKSMSTMIVLLVYMGVEVGYSVRCTILCWSYQIYFWFKIGNTLKFLSQI